MHCSRVDIWVNQMDKYSLKSGRSDSCNSFFFYSLYAAHLYLCCFSHSTITCKLHMFAKSQTFIDEKWNTSNNPSNFEYLNTWLNWNVVETKCSLSNPVSFLLVRLHFSHFHPPQIYPPFRIRTHFDSLIFKLGPYSQLVTINFATLECSTHPPPRIQLNQSI